MEENKDDQVDMKIIEDVKNQSDAILVENRESASTVIDDKFMKDAHESLAEPKSIQAVLENEADLESIDSATEAKLLNDSGDNLKAAEAVASTVAQPDDMLADVSGDTDMEERLWYESDDDTMGVENVSSAIACLNDDMNEMESVDAATKEKLLSDTGKRIAEDKATSSTLVPLPEDKIDYDNAFATTEKKQLDDLHESGSLIENKLKTLKSLVEDVSVSEEKENTLEEPGDVGLDRCLSTTVADSVNQDIDSTETQGVVSIKSDDIEHNSTNNENSSSLDIVAVKENILDTNLNSDYQIESELNKVELLTENQNYNPDNTVKIDIGQSIKAVLETGRSCMPCKYINPEIPEIPSNSVKISDEVNTTLIDTPNTINNSQDEKLKCIKICSSVISDQGNSDATSNLENATEIHEEDCEPKSSLGDAKQMNVKASNIIDIIQNATTKLENTAKTVLDKTQNEDKIVVKADSLVHNVDKCNIIGNMEDISKGVEETNIETSGINESVQVSKIERRNKAKRNIDEDDDNSPVHIKSSHSLHMPDVMLEIPSQELIDIDDVLDSPNDTRIDDFSYIKETDDDDVANKLITLDVDSNKNINNESNCIENSENSNKDIKTIAGPVIQEAQPSTSSAYKFTPDTFDDIPGTSDRLGLLAESQRVHDDDDDDDDRIHDDDDFEHDESSNQMIGEHSEDSNTHQSETDPTKYEEDKDIKEEVDDKISNGSEGDVYEEEQPNLDAVEIEEHVIDTPDADLGVEEEKIISEENNSVGVNNNEDTQDSELHVKETDVNDVSMHDVDSNTETINKVTDDKPAISKQGMQNTKDDAIENSELKDVLVIPEEDAIKEKDSLSEEHVEKGQDTIEDVETEVNSSFKDLETCKDITKESMEKVEDTMLELNEKLEKDKEQLTMSKEIENNKVDDIKVAIEADNPSKSTAASNKDATEPMPDIPTYNLSDSDNDDVTSADTVLNNNKRKSEEPGSAKSDKLAVNKKMKLGDTTTNAKIKAKTSTLNEHVVSIVDLQESSSEEETDENGSSNKHNASTGVTTINLPTDIVVTSTCSAGANTPGILKTQEKTVISRVKAPVSQKAVTRLNTSEVTIKTTSGAEQTLVIPEKQMQTSQAEPIPTEPKDTPVYSIDSDEEEVEEPPKPKGKRRKCINNSCTSGQTVYRTADQDLILYYDASRKRRPLICRPCVDAVVARKQSLINGIREMVPLSQLDMGVASYYPVEVLDSDSEDEEPQPQEELATECIGEVAAKFLEENLAEMLNSTWKKYHLDDRLKETEDEINAELEKIELENKEIGDMLNECQRMTDKLRTELYATFEPRIESEPPLLIYETPEFRYIGSELDCPAPPAVPKNRQVIKRKMAANNTPPAPPKRPSVIPLGYTPLNDPILKVQETKIVANNSDDDKDVSVVKLSAESPPPDLPPPGELTRPPLRVDMQVYAMKNAFGPWLKGRITEIMPEGTNSSTFTSCRVQFDHITKTNNSKVLLARCIAYVDPPNVRMTIGTRLIALFKDSNKDPNKRDTFSSGVVAEAPTPVNNFRYLVFFDDGYAQYVKHSFTRLVCECSNLVWEEVHPFSRDFVKEYLMAFPERPMVRLHQGQNFKTEWNGKWWASRVIQVDASLVQVLFVENGRKEWIYRGSTRLAPLYVELQAAERHRTRALGTRRQPPRNNMPYVEYTRSEEQGANKILENLPPTAGMNMQQQKEELRKQRAVAKKSTTMPASQSGTQQPTNKPTTEIPDGLTSRVVYYTPKNAVRPYKLVPHKCSSQCKRSVLSLEDLRTYNPLAKPLLSGWERQIVRFKGQKEVMYRAPCGRRIRNMKELHRYLQATESELSVDLFDFFCGTHCLAEFQIYKCLTGKKDLSQGRENVPIPCVNYYDHTLPEFCSYNTERTPTSGVPLNLDPEFLCGCDCTDDCEDKSKCACWKMTLEGARTIGLDTTNIGYEYKRLPEPLPSGIYECNSRCKCKNTCLNRVAQHPLQLKLQVFKTLNRGWGIRALNDVPKGAFLCVYAGNLLTDATANLDGLNEGDEYLAELDYIEVVEQMKEGYEADIPDEDKKLDAENSESSKQEDLEESSSSSSEEEETSSKYDKEDDDFKPAIHVGPEVSKFSKHLRKRSRDEDKGDKDKENKEKDTKDKTDDSCITISDDEEAREPSRFAAQAGMEGNEFMSKYKSVRSLFGEDEACYIMDAKVQGNIGRYLNHSCSPNVFVQNVFVDTHDPRFPWVAFFALSHIKAGTELTWNYNYDVGSVPGKVLYCYCQAPNCRGRLL